jgi:tetratricopeptide (TPR) repeat protein
MERVSNSVLRLFAFGAALSLAGSTGRAAIVTPSFEQVPAAKQESQFSLEELQRRAMQEGEAGTTEEAIRDYTRALELQPTWKEGLWNLGTLQYSANRFVEAKATFQKVVQFAPSLGIAWSLLGLSEFETRDYADSVAHLEKAQSLGIQDDAEVQRVSAYHLGLLLIRAGEFEHATGLLVTTFGAEQITPQVKTALGLAMLRVPLLPDQIDPSQDALVLAAGEVASSGANLLARFPALLQTYPNVPYLHYAYGLALAHTNRSKDVVAAFQEEAEISPESPLPWIELSRLQLIKPTEALQAARKAIELAPANKAAHEALAKSLEAAGHADQAATESKVATTLAASPPPPENRIVQRYSDAHTNANSSAGSATAQVIWEQATREYSAAQYPEAAGHLKMWLQANPESGTGWAMLGLCEFAMKDFTNALIHLDHGAQLGLSGGTESLQTARYALGILLVHASDFERASEVLASANTGIVPDPKVKYALGLALLRRPEFPPAEYSNQDRLITTAGEIALLLQQSKYDDAFPQFKRLLADYPSTPFLHYAYGTALLALSEFDEAVAQMHAEMRLSPTSELPLICLASIALRQHKAAEAIEWAQHALDIAPNSVEAHYLLGRASLENGDNTVALHELQIAGKLSPGSPEVHFNLAKAYERAKLPEKAQQERAAFSRLNAVTESQRSQQGTQIYSGPHNMQDITKPLPTSQGASPQ